MGVEFERKNLESGASRPLRVEVDSDGVKNLPNYRLWKMEVRETLGELGWRGAAEYIAAWGHLAPSAHNKQGWELAFDEQTRTMTVWPRAEDIGTPADKAGRETYVGVGCFVQNAVEALQAYGYQPQYGLVEDGQHTGVRFEMENLERATLENRNRLETMKKRRSNRSKYNPLHKLGPEDIEEIKQLGGGETLRADVITDKVTKLGLAGAQELADRIVLMVKDFRMELGNHFAANDTLEGRVMPGDTFGLSDASAAKVVAALKKTGQFDGDFAAGFGRADRDGIASSSAVVVISTDQDTPEQQIEAGMAFERMWLWATDKNLGVAVMAAMVESDMHNMGLKKRLGTGSMRPVVVFRVGQPTEDRFHSPRAELDEVIRD